MQGQQCLRSFGSEFENWGPKQKKVHFIKTVEEEGGGGGGGGGVEGGGGAITRTFVWWLFVFILTNSSF